MNQWSMQDFSRLQQIFIPYGSPLRRCLLFKGGAEPCSSLVDMRRASEVGETAPRPHDSSLALTVSGLYRAPLPPR